MTLDRIHEVLVDQHEIIRKSDWDTALSAFGRDKGVAQPKDFLWSLESRKLAADNGTYSMLTAYQRDLVESDEFDNLSTQVGSERFIIQGPVGSGGQGSVYEARRYQSGSVTLVAVKIPNVDQTSLKARKRFVKECKVLCETIASLKHEDVKRVVKGLLYDDDPNAPKLVMELVRGETLSQYVKNAKIGGLELNCKEVLEFTKELAAAVRFLHTNNLVHRDIKPQNIVLDRDHLVLVDMGLHKNLDESDTESGDRFGTPFYSAPECFVDASATTKKADVYSICATAYFLLTGFPPHFQLFMRRPKPDRKSLKFDEDRIAWLSGDTVDVDLLGFRPDTPIKLAEQITKGLSESPSHRPTLQKLIKQIDSAIEFVDQAEELLPAFRRFRDELYLFVQTACSDLFNFDATVLAKTLISEWGNALRRVQTLHPDVTTENQFLNIINASASVNDYRTHWKECSKRILEEVKEISRISKQSNPVADKKKKALRKQLKAAISNLQDELPAVQKLEFKLHSIVSRLTGERVPDPTCRRQL